LTTSSGNSWHSTIDGDSYGNIHVVWQDDRDGNNEIYYTKLYNDGNTLIDDTRLTNNIAESNWPTIKLDNSDNVHIMWMDNRNITYGYDIYYIKLDNNGNLLVGVTRLTYGSSNLWAYDFEVDSYNNLHFAWNDNRQSESEIYYLKLDNNGNPLINENRLTTAIGEARWPHLDIDNADNIQIAWYDSRDGGAEIYYEKLDNNGVTLVDDKRLTFAGAASGAPTLEMDNSNNVHIIWADNRNGDNQLFYKKLDNTGNTLIDDEMITNLGLAGYLFALDDYDVHISWTENRDGNDEIYYCKLNNNGTKVVNDTRLTFDNADSWWPRIYVDNSQSIHIVWDDNRDGNQEMYYKKGAIVTGVAEDPNLYPIKYALMQNYPNPFNPGTTIEYAVQQSSQVVLKIYSSLGKLVKTLVDDYKTTGEYSASWNGKDNSGQVVSSGSYFYQLKSGDFISAKKMIYIK
jgi:hypothetical protein